MSGLLLDWSSAAAVGPARAGGKGWQLGTLAQLGAPVPPGFVIDSGVEIGRQHGDELSASLVAALGRELEQRGWVDTPLVVRSSASGEDSANASFAGIYRSHLNVRGHTALVEAVRSVLDSTWDSAAAAYRERLGLEDKPSAMAVVVMPLLSAVASGIAFTCDPISGREDQLLIHAHWGLGESLVNGLVEADEYRLAVHYPNEVVTLVQKRSGAKGRMTVTDGHYGTRSEITPTGLAVLPVLSPAQAIALATLVRDSASVLDYTQPYYDVEWVWDGASFWIVQARPITARGRTTYPPLRDHPTVWSRANSRDVLPEPLPALDRSVSLPLIDHMLTRGSALAGYPLLSGLQRTALHCGRLYFETSIMQWEAYDGFAVQPEAYNRMLGGHQPEIDIPRATLGERLHRARRGVRFLLKSVWPRLRSKVTLANAHQTAAEQLARALPASPSDLAERLNAQIIDMRTAEDVLLLQASGSALLVLLDLLEKYFPGEGNALTAAVMTGGEQSATASLGYDLIQLAQTVATDAPALAWLRSPQRAGRQWRQHLPYDSAFSRAFDGFLQNHGHRAVYESYLHRPRWREDPDYLFDTVLSLIGREIKPLLDHQKRNAAAARQRILERLPIWQRPTITLLVKLATAERNMREGARSALTAHAGVVRHLALALGTHWSDAGHLQSPDDVFHLTLDELLSLSCGRLPMQSAPRRASWRRQQYDAFRPQTPPEIIVVSNAPSSSLRSVATPPSVAMGEWRGIVVANGHANGNAHIAHDPRETLSMEAGAILVLPAADPAWTPAFLKAGALIMETGGYLSHGAIVARELGIPAVANVPGILSEIQTGERLNVDADRGVIRRA